MFYDINSAIVAASKGDTIYIQGTQTNYCIPATAKDSLTFIGSGFDPQKQNAYPTVVACGTWALGEYNVVIGMRIQGLAQNRPAGMANLTIKRCYLYNSGVGLLTLFTYQSVDNVIFEDCIFKDLSLFSNCNGCSTSNGGSYIGSAVVRNCLFYDSRLLANISVTVSNMLVDHCVFYNNSPASIFAGVPTSSQIDMTNTIFINADPVIASGTGVTYTYNFSDSQNLNSVNSGSNNLQGAITQFVNSPGGTFNFTHNYHLLAGSPCIGSGTSGSDMGIYGGLTPMRWDGSAGVPRIDFFNILGTQVAPNGNLNIQFKSTTHD